MKKKQPIPAGLPMPEWKDSSGRDLSRGQYIVYAASAGRSSRFKFGIVLETVSKLAKRWQAYDPPPAPGVYPRGDYVDYLQPKIRVLHAHNPGLTGKSTLEYLSRVLIIDESQIPPDVLKTLKEAWSGHAG